MDTVLEASDAVSIGLRGNFCISQGVILNRVCEVKNTGILRRIRMTEGVLCRVSLRISHEAYARLRREDARAIPLFEPADALQRKSPAILSADIAAGGRSVADQLRPAKSRSH